MLNGMCCSFLMKVRLPRALFMMGRLMSLMRVIGELVLMWGSMMCLVMMFLLLFVFSGVWLVVFGW